MRRVIIGSDAAGKAVVLYDGTPQSINHITTTDPASMQMHNVAAFADPVPDGECYTADLWATAGVPMAGAPDLVAEPKLFSMEPLGQGMYVRYQSWGPGLYAGMHATDTLDIDVVISGEVEFMLDGGQTVALQAGDCVVVPGVMHAWRAGPNGVKMLIVMQKLAAA